MDRAVPLSVPSFHPPVVF